MYRLTFRKILNCSPICILISTPYYAVNCTRNTLSDYSSHNNEIITNTNIYTYVCVYVCVFMSEYVHVRVYLCVFECICQSVSVYMFVHVCVCVAIQDE